MAEEVERQVLAARPRAGGRAMANASLYEKTRRGGGAISRASARASGLTFGGWGKAIKTW
jgi:hypothetical protein